MTEVGGGQGEEYVKQSELRWHHGMGAVRSVIKSGHVIVRTATAGTQIPELNEVSCTLHNVRRAHLGSSGVVFQGFVQGQLDAV